MSTEMEEDSKPAALDADDSDVELTGMDMEDDDDDEAPLAAADDDDAAMTAAGGGSEPENEQAVTDMATQEAVELEEARKERMELAAAEAASIKQNMTAANPQERLQYLMAQSEVFAHFLAGSVAVASKKGKGGRGKTGRLTEAEEDAQMLATAVSKRRVIRLDQQPSNLAPHCKMHPYQLEGLNWLIKLHDHGINGILADEM
jgi:SWI/SNF-related matrix-associated actin-dependent regulator of chromatin subfamily A member 5